MRQFSDHTGHLFSKEPLAVFLNVQRRNADDFVVEHPEDEMLYKSTAELVAIFKSHLHLTPPTLDRAGQHLSQPVETSAEFTDHGRKVRVAGTMYQLNIPFDGYMEFFYLTPSNSTSQRPKATIMQGMLRLYFSGAELTQEDVKKFFEDTISAIESYLANSKADCDAAAVEIVQKMTARIEARKAALQASHKIASSLGYPMHAALPIPTTYRAPNVQRRTPPKAAKAYTPEPELTEEDYQHILTIISAMSHVFERSPASFAHLGEEDLRQHLLVPLNGHYPGQATGETFNAGGKSDILIRTEDRNIFIAECKIWGGEKKANDAIAQLLRYVTWRDTKTAIIVFSKAKDFGATLNTLWATVEAHPNMKEGPKVESETRRRYVFRHGTDAERDLILTVLAFNIPKV